MSTEEVNVCVHLVRLLPVERVSDVEERLEDLDDVLGRLLGDGRSGAVTEHLVSLRPPHSQVLLQSCGQYGHSTLLTGNKHTAEHHRQENNTK